MILADKCEGAPGSHISANLRIRLRRFRAALCLAGCLLIASTLRASVEGNVSGTIFDPARKVVPGATVTAINTATNMERSMTTGSDGIYSFQELPVGTYEIHVNAKNFKASRTVGVVLNANSALLLDITLSVGGQTNTVTVDDSSTHVDVADTQTGEVISDAKMEAVPLNGRSFTDLLSLQPGVAPATSITSRSINAAGASLLNPSGDLNPGTISINGQREYANGFEVNDADTVERFTMGAAVIPNLDSLAEFRILTGNFDAEYGNYSGGRISVVTKSGSNAFHGSAFEFLRNTLLDADSFITGERGVYQQNQYGGTMGGPVLRNKLFFFGDYQGTGVKQGVDSGLISVPSAAEQTGNFSDEAGMFSGATVSGSNWAQLLTGKLGYAVSPGELYYSPGCSNSTCVFPNATIPKAVWSGPAQHLIQYIPSPNQGVNEFSTTAQALTLRDDKAAMRIDGSTRLGTLSAYYFADDWSMDNPYPIQQGGANVPGFDAANLGLTQMFTLGDVKTFGTRAANDLHLSYVRDVNTLGTPKGNAGISLASQGFVTPSGTPSILPQRPSIVGIENIIFNSFTIGSTVTGLNQVDNSIEARDGFSRAIGTHTLKAGGEAIYSQVNVAADVQSNGTFLFTGQETGIDFADFLLGVPSQYTQGDARPTSNRNKYGALFIQDSWRPRARLEFNYGLRWDVIMPWYERFNQIQTLVLGDQSVVYPGAPEGIVFPGDSGIPRSLAPARWNNFSPRLGVAWAPATRSGLIGKLIGQDQTSIRLGFGRFFSAVEGVEIGVMAGDPPYGSTYTSPTPPLFADPFVNAADGTDNGQRFPLRLPPLGASPGHPDATVNWAQFEPISGMPAYDPRDLSPYTEQYNLSIERQFDRNTLLTLGYVGSQAHRLLVMLPANPGIASLCLAIAGCGPFDEDLYQTRRPFSAAFSDVTWMSTIGNSNYNALEVNLRHVSRTLELMAGYTYSKSLDNASSVSEQLNPFDHQWSYALSAFDLKHNFVTSFDYALPAGQLFRSSNLFTNGWSISGITHISGGFPITMHNDSDRSLTGLQRNGVNNTWGLDTPDVLPGSLALNGNPRAGPYFNTSLFTLQALGAVGSAKPRFFYGPGMIDVDLSAQKRIELAENKTLDFRIDAFNVFNHPQYFGADSVDGDVSSGTFGQIVNAQNPRLLQAALKFRF
jgi:carboxypeptidase family protein